MGSPTDGSEATTELTLSFEGLPDLSVPEETDASVDEHAAEQAERIVNADADKQRFDDTRYAG